MPLSPEEMKVYRQKNKKRIIEKARLYVENNREDINKRKREWQQENRGPANESKRKWRANNRDKIKAQKQRYAEKYPDKIQEIRNRFNAKRRTNRLYQIEDKPPGLEAHAGKHKWNWLFEILRELDSTDTYRIRLKELGFEKEKREFKSLLTLGRVRSLKVIENLEKIINETEFQPSNEIKIDKLVLFQSTLTPKGAIYAPLSEYPIRNL